jgi:hypothetical protein
LRDDGYMVVLAIRVDKRGNPEFIQIAAKSDGKDYPQYQSGPLAELQIDGTSTPLLARRKGHDEAPNVDVCRRRSEPVPGQR